MYVPLEKREVRIPRVDGVNQRGTERAVVRVSACNESISIARTYAAPERSHFSDVRSYRSSAFEWAKWICCTC